MESVADKAFLLFINYFDPHDPYLPPGNFRYTYVSKSEIGNGENVTPEQLVALYDAEIRYTDHHLGLIIDRLGAMGIYDDTWIIITGDHGELFGEHGQYSHGKTLWEPELHVPLIVKYPKRWARSGRIAEPIQLTDIMPIILHKLGLPMPPNIQGTASRQEPRTLLAEIFPLPVVSDLGHFRAYYEGSVKYIWSSQGKHGLFDLTSDPGETNNLYATRTERASAMQRGMDALVKALPRPTESTLVKKIDQQTMDALRGMGYITGPSKKRPTTTPSTSPVRNSP
jgi:arylsulfatase A-like enzyme